MSRYKAYCEYKKSGLEWLGDIPNDWQIVYSKAVFSERNEKAALHDEQLTASQKYGILPQKLFMEIEQQKVVQVLKGHEILKRVEAEDFVISMRSFRGGMIAEYQTQLPDKKLLQAKLHEFYLLNIAQGEE
jgi:type I restriction enzyme S subunit